MRRKSFPWFALLYAIVGGSLLLVAFLLHLRPPLLDMAVAAKLPWSLGYGLLIWSAITGWRTNLRSTWRHLRCEKVLAYSSAGLGR